jgi:hypothetical protein
VPRRRVCARTGNLRDVDVLERIQRIDLEAVQPGLGGAVPGDLDDVLGPDRRREGEVRPHQAGGTAGVGPRCECAASARVSGMRARGAPKS